MLAVEQVPIGSRIGVGNDRSRKSVAPIRILLERGIDSCRCVFGRETFEDRCGDDRSCGIESDSSNGVGLIGGQIPDGFHAVLGQQFPGRAPYEQQVSHRQGPDDLLPVFPGNDSGGIRLFIVAAQLGKYLVKAHPYGQGKAQFLPNPVAQGVRQSRGVAAEEVQGAGDIQPALVDAEGLHQVGVLLVDGVDLLGDLPVQGVMGRQQHQARALPPGLPDGLRRLDAVFLGGFIFCQDDAVAGGGVSTDRRGHAPQVRAAPQLHGGVKAVQIAVQDDAVHGSASFPPSIIAHLFAFEKGGDETKSAGTFVPARRCVMKCYRIPISTRASTTKVASRARENRRNPALRPLLPWTRVWDSGTSRAFRRAVTTGL